MKTKLWLDDVRPAPDDHHHVQNASAALGALRLHSFQEASLDHDLGHPRMDGNWLLMTAHQHGVRLPDTIHLHTQNPVGRENMAHTLEQMGYERDYTKFSTYIRVAHEAHDHLD